MIGRSFRPVLGACVMSQISSEVTAGRVQKV